MPVDIEEKLNYIKSLFKPVKFLSTQERRELSPKTYQVVYDKDCKNYAIWDGEKWVFWGKPSTSGARLKRISKFPGFKRFEAVAFSINNYGYVGTGYSPQVGLLRDFWRYDSFMDVWTQIADFPIASSTAVAFTINNYGYVGSGWKFEEPSKYFFKYDPSNNTWIQIADIPVRRAEAVAFVINNHGYVGIGRHWDFLSDFYRYNPDTNTWTQIADFGGGERILAASFVLQGCGYVGMGENYDNYCRDFWYYDPSNNTWTQIYMFPASGKSGVVGFNIGNYGYVAGCYRDVWLYDPYNNFWSLITELEYGITFAVAFVINDSAYIGTGRLGIGSYSYVLNDFWQLTNIYP